MQQVKECYVLIMAGGVGSRFWPESRENRPKQFLDILGRGKSLLRLTFERFINFTPLENIFVLTNGQYKNQVIEELPELKEANIFLEPSRNNTAPCIAYASVKLAIQNPEATCIVTPADQVIADEKGFLEALTICLEKSATEDVLCTLGIPPTRPDTGYGYIKYDDSQSTKGPYPVLEFTEKPDKERAEAFLQSGNYLWNAGIFIWSLKSVLRAFEAHASGILHTFLPGQDLFWGEGENAFLEEHYPETEKISIDYAIMEKAENVYTLPANVGWSDLGTWKSVFDFNNGQPTENVSLSKRVLLKDAKGNLIKGPGEKLIVIRGLENYIVVDTDDVLLIYPMDKEQEIKKLREHPDLEDFI